MAVPKRKTSKARKRKRRTHWKLVRPQQDKCGQCGAAKAPHRVCDSCGHYDGQRVVEGNE